LCRTFGSSFPSCAIESEGEVFMSAMETVHPREPFRGLEPFRFSDRSIFFERKQELKDLLRLVLVRRAVLLYGESGVGKSSLINAGLLPAAIDEGLEPIRLRIGSLPGAELIVERISLGDTSEAGYLESSFVSELHENSSFVISCAELEDRVREGSSKNTSPLLIFDQFEEFITLAEEVTDPTRYPKVCTAQGNILGLVSRLTHDNTLPVKLLFVFREEYLAKLSDLFARCPQLLEQHLRLVPPSTDGLLQIVGGPFRNTLQGATPPFQKEFTSGLISKLVRLFSERCPRGKLNLSEIQVVCLRLWRSSDPEMLLETRGIQGLLEDFLNDALRPLPYEVRDIAISILTKLVTRAGTRNIASAEHLATLIHAEESVSPRDIQIALGLLVADTKLVRKERRRESFFYEIVSEFLIPWILSQQKFRGERLQRRQWTQRVAIGAAVTGLALVPIIWIQHTQAYRSVVLSEVVHNAQRQTLKSEKLLKDAELQRNQESESNRLLQTSLANSSAKILQLTRDLDSRPTLDQLRMALAQASQARVELQASQQQAAHETSVLQGSISTLNSKIAELSSQNHDLTQQVASLPKPPPPTKMSPGPGGGSLVIYAIGEIRYAKDKRPEVYIDNLPYAFVIPSTAFSVRVPVGHHEVCVAAAVDPCETIVVDVTSDSTVHIKVSPNKKNKFYVPMIATVDGKGKDSLTLQGLPPEALINTLAKPLSAAGLAALK
jgi:hypothetical protein